MFILKQQRSSELDKQIANIIASGTPSSTSSSLSPSKTPNSNTNDTNSTTTNYNASTNSTISSSSTSISTSTSADLDGLLASRNDMQQQEQVLLRRQERAQCDALIAELSDIVSELKLSCEHIQETVRSQSVLLDDIKDGIEESADSLIEQREKVIIIIV